MHDNKCDTASIRKREEEEWG